MKWFTKINRGVILTAIIVIGVIVYLVGLSLSHKAQIPAIQKICEEYVVVDVQYSMLPVNQRKEVPDMSNAELTSYLNEMKTAISAYFPKDENSVKFELKSKTASLTAQASGQDVIYSYSKTIKKFTGYVYDKDTVTVSFLSDTSIEKNMIGKTGALEKTKLNIETTDQIILNKESGEWRVIYTSITKPDMNQPGYPSYR